MDKRVKEIIFNFREFAPRFLKIKDEFGNIVPLMFNTAQNKILDKILPIFEAGKPIRLIILKARQQGISTLMQAFIFWYLLTHPNQKALTMGHKLDASNNLFDMYKRFYDKLPKPLQPKLLRSNEKKISYTKLGSENKIETAGSGEIGRSDTFQVIHATELSFYPDIKNVLIGLMQGAKYARIQVIESTANGFNEFHKLWKDAEEGKGGFVPIFLSWLEFPEYIENAKRLGFLDKYKEIDFGNSLYNEFPDQEKILKEQYGATDDQLRWRRYMIDSPAFNGDLEKFRQEYPHTPEAAFLATGRPVFNMNIVNNNLKNAHNPVARGDLIPIYDKKGQEMQRAGATYLELKEHIEDVEFVPSERGFIKIWTEPKEIKNGYYRYVMGGDIAEGLEQGDYTALRVLDRESDEIYLTWHGHLDADLIAEEVHKIYLFLGKDLFVGIEKNNQGITVINKLFELGVPQYYRESFRKGYGQASKSDIGFLTNTKTKPYMINLLNEYIRDGLYYDYDPEFWKEASTFVRNSRGQMQAEGKDKDPSIKNFDDRIMAEAIMLVVNQWLPNFSYTREEDIPSRVGIITNRRKAEVKF